MFTILDHDKFEPSTRRLYENTSMGSRSYVTYKQNPTKAELKRGIYKPRVTVTKRFNNGVFEAMMKIEFSAPKLIFGNNFDELEDKDFPLVINRLREVLRGMGVYIYEESLINAPVSSIHYSKNIELRNGITPSLILEEIGKSNITQRLHFNHTDFKNGGQSVKWHANSYEIAFYDKLKDLQEAKISEKRAEEKDNALQISIFEDLKRIKQEFLEVLRIEIRLNQKQKIKSTLKEVGIEAEPTFKNLFKKYISQKVLLYFLEEIEEGYPRTLHFSPESNKDFIAQFIIDNPHAGISSAILAFGFKEALHEMSVRELRELLKVYPRSSWYKFFNRMNSFNYSKANFHPFQILKESLLEFKTCKIEAKN